MRKTNHCRSEDSACNARPVHTDGSRASVGRSACRFRSTSTTGPSRSPSALQYRAKSSCMGECRSDRQRFSSRCAKDKGSIDPRCCNSRSGLTIRSGDNPTSTVAATRIGRMGGWVCLSNHEISARRRLLEESAARGSGRSRHRLDSRPSRCNRALVVPRPGPAVDDPETAERPERK